MQLHLSSDGKAFVEGVRSAQRKAGRRNSASCQSAAKLGADRAGVDVRASAALICIARLRKAPRVATRACSPAPGGGSAISLLPPACTRMGSVASAARMLIRSAVQRSLASAEPAAVQRKRATSLRP